MELTILLFKHFLEDMLPVHPPPQKGSTCSIPFT